jgi:tripartite-type tricarboxylate transporter receptor subunit TctC
VRPRCFRQQRKPRPILRNRSSSSFTRRPAAAPISSRDGERVHEPEKIFSQPLVVSNKPGGSGAIAFGYVKGKRGDPHVVLTMATGSFLAATGRPELGLGLENFTPIASLALDPQAIAVPWDSKYKTIKDLIEAGKREPNAIASSITSATGTARVLLYLIERETGAKFKYVSFKSGSKQPPPWSVGTCRSHRRI